MKYPSWGDNERSILQNALFCAAAEYDKITIQMHSAKNFRLAEQFKRQATAARTLNDELESQPKIVIE